MTLTDTLKDIATPIGRDVLDILKGPPGPNRWDEITEADYGRLFDYRILRRGSNTVVDPCSEAAIQWMRRFLPEDCPRWGSEGRVIESKYVGAILERMAGDKLLSEDDYLLGMEIDGRDRHQGEDR